MTSFVCGFLVGYFFKEIKWLTYDLLKAIAKGIYYATRGVCFGELKPGRSRWNAVCYFPRLVWYEVGLFLKWEWLNGCKVNHK